MVWSAAKRRIMLPGEVLEAQGVGPVYIHQDYNDEDEPEDVGPTISQASISTCKLCEVVKEWTAFTGMEVRSFGGNGMQVPVVGSIQLYILSCTVPVRPAACASSA